MLSQLSLVQTVISLSVLIFVAFWGWVHWRYRRLIAFARKLPTALPTFPLLGHLLYMRPIFKLGLQTGDSVELFMGGSIKGVSCIWMGPIPWIVFNKAEDIRNVLNNSQSLRKSNQYKLSEAYMGRGLLTAPVNVWKKSRKRINPIFSPLNMKEFIPSFNDSARRLALVLENHVDVEEYVFDFALVNILKILYGPDFKINPDEFKILLAGAKTIGPAIAQRAINPLLAPDILFRLIRNQEWKILQNLQKTVKDLNKEASIGAHHMSQQDKEEPRIELNEGRTILDIASVLSGEPEFNDDYKNEEAITLIITGSDTNVITLSSWLLALGTHPAIQDNLYNEIVSVVGEDSEDVTFEDINKMPYLDQVIKETLRRFVVVPVIGRSCDKDIKLNEYTIPQYSTVYLSLWGLLLDPQVFPNPLRFEPNRFSPENVAKRDSHCFLPFSGGPRGCIGKTFAMIAMKITLVHLLRIYEIRSDVNIDDLRFTYGLVINSTTGYHISVKRRSVR